ncbi:membrane protein [Helicobacter fennelliae]|uniref:Membrane protein n=2 Tax=Helicobacter TaxID=209 RepID=A0A2X3BEK2_9HELI|nr:hypothetical protein [Helicobacter fennelliae]SQB98214.1 membrane protein [Helicobacter fennelliae]
MKNCYKCFIVLGAFNILVACILWYVLGLFDVLNFEVAYFSTFLVIIASYIALKNNLKYKQESHTKDELLHYQEAKKSHKFALGVQLSFGLYRILSYTILALGIIILINSDLFRVIGYIVGVFICLASIIAFKLKHYKHYKH